MCAVHGIVFVPEREREMSYTDAVQDAGILADAHEKPSVLVPIVRATPESVIGYGNLVRDFHAEDIIRVTWPKLTGSRPVVSGTGNLQVITSVIVYTKWLAV